MGCASQKKVSNFNEPPRGFRGFGGFSIGRRVIFRRPFFRGVLEEVKKRSAKIGCARGEMTPETPKPPFLAPAQVELLGSIVMA